MTNRRAGARVLAIAAVAALPLAGIATTGAAFAPPSGPTEYTDLGVTGDDVLAHLAELSEISEAYAADGFRAYTSAGYAAAAEYVEGVLAGTGAFDVEREYFDVEGVTYGEVSLVIDGEPVAHNTLSNGEGTTEPLVGLPLSLPDGESETAQLGCEAADFTEDNAGTVVLVQRGVCAFGQKVTVATEAGAAAVLIYNNADGNFNGTVGERVEGNAPALSLSGEDGTALVAAIEAATEPLLADLTLEVTFEVFTTFNIIASTKGGDPNSVQVSGAHLDGVDTGPGVNDDASGVAALLAVAEAIAEQPTAPDRQIRLGFWGAEEAGLVGSTYYVENLAAEELSKIKSYLNYDMIGSDNFVVAIYEGDEDLNQIYIDYFDSIPDYFDPSVSQQWVPTPFSGRSDYAAFVDNDIPSTGLFSGADDIKTEEEVALFGGEAGVPQDTNYHTINDTLENISRDSLNIFSPAIGYATHVVGWDLVKVEEPTPEPTPEPPATEPPTTGEPTTAPPTTGEPTTTGDAAVPPGDGTLATTGADIDVWSLVSVASLMLAAGVAITAVVMRRNRGKAFAD